MYVSSKQNVSKSEDLNKQKIKVLLFYVFSTANNSLHILNFYPF